MTAARARRSPADPAGERARSGHDHRRRYWRAPRGRADRHPPPDQPAERFGFLLLILVLSYLLSAFLTGPLVTATQIVLFVAVASLAARTGWLGRRSARVAVAIAVGGSVVAVTLAITHPSDAAAGLANLWAALILLFAVALIVRRVLSHPTVTLQSILGAVSAYMIIGLMFAAVYAAMNKFGNGAFFAHGAAGNVKTFQYFSFSTLTTLGYGDYTAAGSDGQAVAVMEALGGQIFLATLVARLVAGFRAPERRPERRAGRRTRRWSARTPRRPVRRPRAGRQPAGGGERRGRAPRTAATALPATRRTSSPGRARPGHR